MAEIKEVKRTLKITDKHIADAFGYASVHAYRNSNKKPQVEAGICWLFDEILKPGRPLLDGSDGTYMVMPVDRYNEQGQLKSVVRKLKANE